jgi:hypothetical protein
MKPTLRLILLAIIIFIFGSVPVVNAVEPSGDDFGSAVTLVCGESPASYPSSIDAAKEVDYYSINLVAGQRLIIDVDTVDNGVTLDSLLEVFDSAGNLIAANDRSSEVPINEDPYLEITVDLDGTYYLAISAASAGEGDVLDPTGNTGSYTLLFKCSDATTPPAPVEQVKVGDLLGATGFDPASLLSINPADGTSTVRFPFEYGKIADVEFDPGSQMLFVAMDDIPGSIIVVDPNTGSEIQSFNYEKGGFLALEAAENILFGIYVEFDDYGFEQYSLVTIDKTSGATSPVALSSRVPPIRSLAYHPSEKIMYGVSGEDLIKLNLTSSAVEIQKVGSPGLGAIVALDFSHENVLYCVDIAGNLFRIPDLTLTSAPVKVGSIIATTEVATLSSATSRAPVSGLTFVVGESVPDEEPIKTICSSSFTSPGSTSSELANSKLTRFKLKMNPLHRGIGMFKFQGKNGETLTLSIDPEDSEPVDAEKDSKVGWLKKLWSRCKEKERVFVSIRDAIPGVKFRVKEKSNLPLHMTVGPLEADGWYYVMVIRPLPRFHDVDYCLSLDSDNADSQVWKTLDVVWPGDDSEENTTSLADGQQLAEPLTEDAAVDAASNAVSEPESTTLINESATVSPVPISTNLTAGETLVESSTEGDNEGRQTAGDTNLVAPAAETPKEMTVEATEEPTLMDAPLVPEETMMFNEAGEVAPLEEPAAEPTMKGAPSIPEETTVDAPGEDPPEPSKL